MANRLRPGTSGAATRQSLCGICVGGAMSTPTTRPRRAMAQMLSQVLMRCRWSIAAPYSRRAMIRVVVAEDAYLVREGIRRLLEPEPDIEVAAVCEDLPSLLAAIDSEEPDVVLTDIRMPPTGSDEGIQVADRLRETSPETGVVVLSQFAAPEYAPALLEN